MEKTSQMAYFLQSVSNALLCEGVEGNEEDSNRERCHPKRDRTEERDDPLPVYLYPLQSGQDIRVRTTILCRGGMTASTG